MTKFYFHLVFESRCDLDLVGRYYKAPHFASSEAVLVLLSLAFKANVTGKEIPKQIAVVCGSPFGQLHEVVNTDYNNADVSKLNDGVW